MARIAGQAKCDDVTALWNCSHDKSHAFRCADDAVEVATCDGDGACEVEPNGQDDLCHVAPASVLTPGEVPVPGQDGAGATAPPALGPPPEADDGGCSVAAGAAGAGRADGGGAPRGLAFGAFATALVCAGAARRRRGRAKA
jgi:hypothetical protein